MLARCLHAVSLKQFKPRVLQERTVRVNNDDDDWIHPQPDGGPKTIFDAWEDDEEEEIGL